MARITVEDCLSKENNRFSLILLAAQRAKQLLSGAKLLIPETDNKAIVNSLREIAAGKVRYMNEEDLRIRREQEEAEREAALAQAAQNEPVSRPLEMPVEEVESTHTNGNGVPSNGIESEV
jgi:DNA-directed RNA polymerase subunit omega